MGGGAAVAKVRRKWPHLDAFFIDGRVGVGLLRDLSAHMTASQFSVRSSCTSSEVTVAIPKVPPVSFPSVAPEDTTASSMVPTISSQSTLIGIYHESSDGVSPYPEVPVVPSNPRNDSQLKMEATLDLATQQLGNDRKYKSTEAPEAVVDRHDHKCKCKTLPQSWKLMERVRASQQKATFAIAGG